MTAFDAPTLTVKKAVEMAEKADEVLQRAIAAIIGDLRAQGDLHDVDALKEVNWDLLREKNA